MHLKAWTNSNELSVESYGFKSIEVVTQTSSVKISEHVKENNDAPLIEDWESEGEDKVESSPEIERKTVEPRMDKVEVDIPKQNEKPARRPVKYIEMYITQRSMGNQKNWNNLKSHQLGDGPKWLFDIDALTELMNYVSVITSTNLNDFVGKGASFDAGQSSIETGPSQDYILMPLWNDSLLFDSSSKDLDGDNKDNDGPCKESEIDNQERPYAENSTKDVNTARPSINTVSSNINIATSTVNTVRQSDDFFVVDNDMRSIDGVEFGVQTRRMTVTTNEQGFISAIYEEKTHEDLHTCLFACFLSKDEPKRITNALKDPAWVEAMQEELLQFHLQKIDIKSAFLYRRIEEEVYVCQPPRFEDPDYPDKVYKVKKALYGLHQAPRAWYETLAKYLLNNGFHRGKIDQTLFIERQKEDILLVQVYVDDIIFGSTKKEMSDGIFISQDKYVDEILRKFKYADVKPASTPMYKEKALLKDSDGDDVDTHLYRSMIGSLMYLTSSRPDIMSAMQIMQGVT
nr:hypothetical protein [Tanacetum cinerariifolium]